MAKQAQTAPAVETTEEEGKSKISSFAYVNNAGDVSKQVKPDSIGLTVSFANGTKDRINIDELSSEILACATLQGLAIKLQRSFASAKGDVEKAVEAFETVKDNLLNGIWAEKGEGSGPRVSILAEAVEAVLTEAGQTVDADRRASIIEKLKDEATREKTKKDPKVNAHYERIKAARAAEKAAKAQEAAGAADTSLLESF